MAGAVEIINAIVNAIGKLFAPRVAMLGLAMTFLILAVPGVMFPDLLTNKQRQWVNLAFCVFALICLMHIGEWAWKRISVKTQIKRNRKIIAFHLRHLTIPEKHILQMYIEEGTKSKMFQPYEGVVASLVEYGILYQATHGDVLGGCPYNVNAYAWGLLLENPALVETSNNPRTE